MLWGYRVWVGTAWVTLGELNEGEEGGEDDRVEGQEEEGGVGGEEVDRDDDDDDDDDEVRSFESLNCGS